MGGLAIPKRVLGLLSGTSGSWGSHRPKTVDVSAMHGLHGPEADPSLKRQVVQVLDVTVLGLVFEGFAALAGQGALDHSPGLAVEGEAEEGADGFAVLPVFQAT